MQSQPPWRVGLLMAALVIMWGISWPIYKNAIPYVPPLLFAGMRTLFGGALLTALFWRRRSLIRWRENKFIYINSALLNIALFYGLQTIGLTLMPSGLFSVITYVQPVLVGILAWIWLKESMSAVKLIGFALGFCGVLVVSAGGLHGHASAAGIALALITALSWAFGAVYIKRVGHRVDPVWLAALQSLLGGIVLTSAGSVAESWPAIVWNAASITGLAFGTTIGIAVSWIVYFVLVEWRSASEVASYTFLVPLIAVCSGTVLLHEPFTVNLLAGIVCIGGSVFMVNRRSKQATAAVKNGGASRLAR
ncbi:DMT family transporter [Paenibacillus cymbidii]|uniref:DMT family transporter n=1 Tax=Paenibacillus cymbidii TaxID=1639034 RepID=UPI001080D2CB|nr:DMT family transporter [Paenibacillus cymbidii]